MSDQTGKFLENRTVLVTGGGTGIGRAIAIAMAAKGGRVLVTGRRAEYLEETVRMIREDGGEAKSCVADVSIESDAQRVMQFIGTSWSGGLDVLVNNAGIFRRGRIVDTSNEDFDIMFGVNVRGIFIVTKAAIEFLKKSERGTIINISSVAGSRADMDMGIYEATKAAVNTMTRVLAKELADIGVRVNAIAPGPTDTPSLYHGTKDPEEREQTRNAMSSMVPFGRLASPEEVARLAVFLASPEADFISGSITNIDGGMGY
ncbi:SDR family oxidoreductase [bacterium]|nr:SDR family oxidoreductase [bacterium]